MESTTGDWTEIAIREQPGAPGEMFHAGEGVSSLTMVALLRKLGHEVEHVEVDDNGQSKEVTYA